MTPPAPAQNYGYAQDDVNYQRFRLLSTPEHGAQHALNNCSQVETRRTASDDPAATVEAAGILFLGGARARASLEGVPLAVPQIFSAGERGGS